MRALEWFRTAFAQDDFADDWYGWLTNQISHIGLGIALSLAVSAIWFFAAGEFPHKLTAWALCLVGYSATEVIRGWRWRDSLEDVAFVCAYGAGGALLLFSEVTPGSPLLIVSVSDILPTVAIASAHLGWGVFLRA